MGDLIKREPEPQIGKARQISNGYRRGGFNIRLTELKEKLGREIEISQK